MTVLPSVARKALPTGPTCLLGPSDPGPSSPGGPVVRMLVGVLRFYRRWISPALPPSCRFSPSCSAYAMEALIVHGMLRGSWWTVRRILRCGPWHPGGADPVPPARSPRSHAESES